MCLDSRKSIECGGTGLAPLIANPQRSALLVLLYFAPNEKKNIYIYIYIHCILDIALVFRLSAVGKLGNCLAAAARRWAPVKKRGRAADAFFIVFNESK